MKNSRWSRLTAWLVMLVMVLTFSVLTAVSLAEEGTEGVIPPAEETQKDTVSDTVISSIVLSAPLEELEDVTANADFSFVRADGKTVSSPADMDPNQDNTMRISITGLSTEEDPAKTPVLGVTLPENIQLTSDGVSAIGGEVTGSLGENGMLELRWIGDKAENVTVELPVIPHLPTDNDLSGTYALGTASKVLLGTESFRIDNRDKLRASAFTEENGGIRPMTNENPLWVLSHVSGNYYTVRSAGTGMYLRIDTSSNSLYLVNSSEQEAQKFLIEKDGDYYAIKYNGWAVNNSNNNPEKGFGSWKYGGGNNEKFRLYSAESLIQTPSVDLSGTWVISNNSKGAILAGFGLSNGRLTAVLTDNLNGSLLPRDDISYWTFTHTTRDWYTVETNGEYLNIDGNGAYLSATPQELLVKPENGGSKFTLGTGEFTSAKMLALIGESAANGFGSVNSAKNNQTYISVKSPDAVHYTETELSGTYAVTTESSGAALIAETNGSGKLASVRYAELADGTVSSDTKQITSWYFNKIQGNWYTVQSEEGYLSVSNSGVGVSASETRVYIQEWNGKYRLTAGNQWSMNNAGGNATYGYKARNSNGNAADVNDWQTLRVAKQGVSCTLIFDANGGAVSNLPSAIAGEAGDEITLPNLEGSLNGGEFMGWYTTSKFYAIASGEKSTYHVLLKPGTSYKMPSGKTTLYAVYNTTSKDIRFGIRTDGVIQEEPNVYSTSAYKGHFWMKNVRITSTWVVDTDSQKPVNGYYLENNVTAALSQAPSAEQIRQALLDEGNIQFNPDTQYIHWYVLKYTGSEWHIDGVIRDKASVEITYVTNVENANERMAVRNLPGGYQVAVGTEVLIGTERNSSKILTPERDGYVFTGWNTKADGTGKEYAAGSYVRLTENMHLYAQWKDVSEGKLAITITSDWPEGKPAYAGTPITLTANLTGFENKDYTLQWQYSPDARQTWVDIPGANKMTYTYEMSAAVSDYIWRAVARDVKNKE